MQNLLSPREIASMRNAGLVVWEAHQLAAKMVKSGTTTAEIDAAVEEHFHRKGAIPLFKGVPGKVPFPAVTCMSVNEAVVHGIPNSKELVEGDILSIDTGCKLDGWCGDSAFTHPVGVIDDEKKRLLEVTQGVLKLAIDQIAHCKMWSEVAKQMEDYVRKANFSVVENFVGHGIGREMHEDPQVPNFVSGQFRRRGDFRLEPGLVIAIEPMVNAGTKYVEALPDYWTQVTEDRRPSAHFEHTVAITEKGAEVLTAGPEEQLMIDYE